MHPNGNAPYQKMPPPPMVSRGQVSHSVPLGRRPVVKPAPPHQHHIRAAHKPKPLPPTEDKTPPSRGMLIPTVNPVTTDTQNGGKAYVDKQTGRIMMLASLAFLIFYILLVASKLLNDRNNNTRVSFAEQQTQVLTVAAHISNTIEDNIAWIAHGISDGKNAQQAAKTITHSPNISSVAILNSQNKIIAQHPAGQSFLSQVSLNEVGDNQYEVSSVIEPSGKITPIIITKSGNYYIVAALRKHALINLENNQSGSIISALIAPSGRVIDGGDELGKVGLREWFNLTAREFEKISVTNSTTLESLVIRGKKYRLVSQSIPNSQLKLLQAKPSKVAQHFKENIFLFSALFIGTCVLITMLLNSLFKQLKSAQNIQRVTEVSQQRYQAAIEGDSGGIWELDIPENTAYLSASLSALLGMPRLERSMSMSQFLNIFHPNEREKFLSVVRRAHIQGEFNLEIGLAHLPMVLQCRGRTSTRSERNFKRVIVGVAIDITEQKLAQSRLKAAETRLHSALSSMTDSFVVWDPSNRLVMWNVKFQEFFQLKPGTINVGAEHASVDYLAQTAIAEKYISQENPDCTDIKLKDGRWIRYIETKTAEGGRVSVGTDITELRMREAELRKNSTALKNTVDVLRESQDRIFELAERYEQEKIRAEEANQSKTDFLASMSHELRTPLNAINGFSDIMKKEMFGPLGDPRYKEYISDILFSGQHLLTLINDILDMSKIEAGKMNLNTEVVFMHELIAQVGRIIRGRAEEAHLNLNIGTQKVHEIEADPRAIKQILINLLTNAIKFTPEGGTVGIELVEKKTGIIIKVHDSGIGISQENIERLAKPFEQIEDEENKLKEGTGLGLALSKSLIELHGGNFKIESEVGKGTTVVFSLPNTPIIQVEEPETKDMSQEISRLAKDIENVLSEDEIQTMSANEAETLLNPTPNPYAPPPVKPSESSDHRPAA